MNRKSKILTHPLARLDHHYVWHPFTQMRDWLKREPIVIVEGKGSVLRDAHGKEYLDANSSIWTNLHGHNHRKINAAISRQMKKIAHSSALGFANEPASVLAEKLVGAANAIYDLRFTIDASAAQSSRKSKIANPKLEKVFFSDDGSTALEVALKLASEFARRTTGIKQPRFLSLKGAYHGDTVGAVSLGHVDLFHKAYSNLLFKTDEVMAPYCYRCPFNRARPERADARLYRKCNWECVAKVEQKFEARKKRALSYAAFAFEPLMQGAGGMIPQPSGWLRRVAEIARSHGAQLIADEVMTGFGRAVSSLEFQTSNSNGLLSNTNNDTRKAKPIFACHQESVQPDLLCLAKGLSGGYLPMAATLTTQAVFDAFLGEYEEFKTFFHGHSFTGNQLGAASSLASFEILQSPRSQRARARLEEDLRRELDTLWTLPHVGDIRQVGLVTGIELVRNWRTREPFALKERAGMRVCDAMAERGVLTRPIGNVVVLMPPYCTTPDQLKKMVAVMREGISTALGTG